LGIAMNDRESTLRSTLITYFPMFIATLSLVTSIYNGYLNSKFVDLIQRNVARVEYMRTCKEIIDAYFQVKFRAGVVNAAGRERASAPAMASSADIEAKNAVARFAALGTYLANLRDDAIRQRYTELSQQLEKVAADAGGVPAGELEKMFAPADRSFSSLNDDCVRSAKSAPM
jgi:hypothetical protein